MLSNFHHGTGHGANYGNTGNAGNAGNSNSVNLRPVQYLPFHSFYQHSLPPPIKHELHTQPHAHPFVQPLPQPLSQPLSQSHPIRKISIHEINVFKKPEKRKRKKFNEVERFYSCNHPNCNKSYGTLNHLNSHIFLQNHGRKRLPQEFKEIRLKLKLKRKLEREKDREQERSRREQREKENHPSKQGQNDRQILAIGVNNNANRIDAGNKMLNPPIYNTYFNNNSTTNINTTGTDTHTNNNPNTNTNTNTGTTAGTMTTHNNNYFTHTPTHYSNYPDYTNYINYPNSLYSPRNTTLSSLNANLNYAFNLNNYKI